MKKIFVLVLLSLVGFTALKAQPPYKMPSGETSLEVSFGPSTLFASDIGTPFNEKYFFDSSSDMHSALKLINSTISVGFQQEYDEKLAYKISVFSSSFERPKFDDNNNRFLSNVFELAGRVEYSIWRTYDPVEKNLFLHLGLGFAYASYILNPLPAVASDPVNVLTGVVPFGIGYRQNLTDRFKIGGDLNAHYFLSDQIEGRGETSGLWPQDVSLNISLTLSYVIFEGNKPKLKCKCDW